MMYILLSGDANCAHLWEYHLHGNFQECSKCHRVERYELPQS